MCVGVQKSRLIETAFNSTHNICCGSEIRKNNQVYTPIWGPELNYIYNPTPQDMHNILFQVWKNPQVNKGINNYTITATTVLPAKSDNDIMFCLQSYQGLIMDRSRVY